MVKVSIIIPVFNGDKYIEDCLKSVLAQTLKEIEVICVNDGSTDNSLKILRANAYKDNRLIIINNEEKKGVTKARNIGLEAAAGEYVFYIDSDDWINEDFVEKLYCLANEFHVDAVLGGMTLVWEDRREEKLNQLEEGLYKGRKKLDTFQSIYDLDNKEVLLKWNIWGNLYNRDKYYEHQIIVDERIKIGEDMAAFIPFIIAAESIYVTNVSSYYYRQHQDSAMHSKSSKSKDYYYLWEYLKPYLEKHFLLRRQIEHICCSGIENDYVGLLNLKRQNFYMFPYELIPVQSKIVIFGAGLVGQAYYRQLKINNYCHVVQLVDNGYENSSDNKYPIVAPALIKSSEYDYVLIALMNKEAIKAVYNQLLYTYDVNKEKIITHIPKMVVDFVDFE